MLLASCGRQRDLGFRHGEFVCNTTVRGETLARDLGLTIQIPREEINLDNPEEKQKKD
jgi:hypothetical protein